MLDESEMVMLMMMMMMMMMMTKMMTTMTMSMLMIMISTNMTINVESIHLWTSDNVVAENLKATRGLNTIYYATSSDQSTDFFWDRESGLGVIIGVNKVDLSATFYGVKPDSDDNDFVLEAPQSPVTEAEKERFRNQVATFCR